MTAVEETKSILRRILFTTIFLFAIFGITSIGILVDRSRKKRSVSLSTALILLAILLAFLVIFAIIICFWRQANHKSRLRNGRDEEERWINMPDGSRRLLTTTELRDIERRERSEIKRQRREKDRQRAIWNNINTSRARISGRDISAPREARNADTGSPLGGHEPLNAHPIRRPVPDNFFDFRGGIFGERPAYGAGLNPNHSLSPPASPRSQTRVTLPARVRDRPTDSNQQNRIESEGAQGGPPWQEECKQVALSHVRREEVGSPTNDVERAEEGRDRKEQGREGGKWKEKVEEVELLVLTPRGRNMMRKQVGTPPRGDRGVLGAKLHNGGDAEATQEAESGAVIGVAGERVVGVGKARLPSKLVAHGLIAIPPDAHHPRKRLASSKVETRSGRNGWRRRSGYYAHKKDEKLSMVSEEKSGGAGSSEASKRSWGEMTADEVERERERMKGKPKEKGKGKSTTQDKPKSAAKAAKAATDSAHAHINNDSRHAQGSHQELRIINHDLSPHGDRTQIAAADLERSPSGIHRKTQQERERMEEEQWLRCVASFQFGNDEEEPVRRKSGDGKGYPYQHLSALPDGLKIPPKQPSLKKPKTSMPEELRITIPKVEEMKQQIEAARRAQDGMHGMQGPIIEAKTYQPSMANRAAHTMTKYQRPTAEEQREDETEWQAQKRIKEWNETNEAEKAREEMLQALQPPPQTIYHTSSSPHHALNVPKVESLSGWIHGYKAGARERGVSGFTEGSFTTNASAFPSFEDVQRERKEKAAEEERRKFSQFMASTEDYQSGQIDRVLDSSLVNLI